MILPHKDVDVCIDCQCSHEKRCECVGCQKDERFNKHSYNPKPRVGMGVTIPCGSDRYPGTIVDVSQNCKTIWVRRDDYRRTDTNGMSESQTYEFSVPDEPSVEFRVTRDEYTLRKNGRYVLSADKMRGGQSIGLGHRSAYYDFSF